MNVFIDCGAHDGAVALKNMENDVVYLIEPNPNFTSCLKSIEDEHNNVVFLPWAAWIEECDKILTQGVGDQAGSSFFKKRLLRRNKTHTVKCVCFSDWLKQFSDEDHITLSMDIEGSEYPVLNHMIEQGIINKIDEITVEFHYKKLTNPSNEIKKQHNKIVEYLQESKIKTTLWRANI